MALHDIYSGRELDRASYADLPAGYDGRSNDWRGREMSATPVADRPPGVLAVLWRRKSLILATVLLCGGAGAAYIAATPPRYTATAAMLIDPRLGKSVGDDPNTHGFIADSAAIDSQIKLFTSQTVLARVAAQAGLSANPEFNGHDRSLLQRLLHPSVVLDGGADLRALEDSITINRPERTYVV